MRVEVVLAYSLHTMGLQLFLKKNYYLTCTWVFTRDLHFDVSISILFVVFCKRCTYFWSKMELIRPCSVVIGLIFYEKLKIVGNIHILFYFKKSRILVSSQVKSSQTQGTFKIMHPL